MGLEQNAGIVAYARGCRGHRRTPHGFVAACGGSTEPPHGSRTAGAASGTATDGDGFALALEAVADGVAWLVAGSGASVERELGRGLAGASLLEAPRGRPPASLAADGDVLRLRWGDAEFSFDPRDLSWRFIAAGQLVAASAAEHSIYHGYLAPPLCRRRRDGAIVTSLSLAREPGEAFYGLGERFTDFNQRGMVVDIHHVDPANTLANLSYLAIPLCVSSRGRGVLVNSSRRSLFDLGARTAGALTVGQEGDVLSLLLLAGPTPRGVIARYHDLAGRPGLPPFWSFGTWFSSLGSYTSDEGLLAVARELRGRRVPAEMLHVDPVWMGERTLVCTLAWGAAFPGHAATIRELHGMGFRLGLWIAPYVPLRGDLFREGLAAGHFLKDAQGRLLVDQGPRNFWSEPFAYVDFTSPAAARWFRSHLERLLDEGVDFFKVDLGELGPGEAAYANGMDGAEGHNYYPLAYQRAVAEAVRARRGGDAFTWSRSGYVGSQRYPVHWAGDVPADFPNMAGQLRAVLSAGASGLPFFGHDIGGFTGTPTPELYVRWFQWGMFSSHARAHGTAPHEPWHYGERALEICRRYAELRYSLLPTIWSAAAAAVTGGVPLVEALAFAFPGDPSVRDIDDEYLFCADLLVAPLFTPGGTREAYLPRGRWIDFADGTAHEGGRWIGGEYPLERLPLWVRAGAVLFRCEPRSPLPGRVDDLDVRAEIWPDGPTGGGEGTMRWADGSQTRVRWSAADGSVVVRQEGGRRLPCALAAAAAGAWRLAGEGCA